MFTGHSKKIDVTTYGGKNSRNPVHEDETYWGRTNFFWSEFNKGNVSLHLKNVTLSDKGKYTCSVFFENWYDEAVVDLDVAGEWNGRHLLLLPLSSCIKSERSMGYQWAGFICLALSHMKRSASANRLGYLYRQQTLNHHRGLFAMSCRGTVGNT